MSDALLLSIASAAEKDETYGISVVTADGGLFEGLTAPAEAFFDRSEEPLVHEAALRLAEGRQRKVEEHLPHAKAEVSRLLDRMRAHQGQEIDAVTLAPAHWIPQHGQYSLRFPVVRISLGSVSAWWIVSGEVTEQAKQGGSWFVGGLFPTS